MSDHDSERELGWTNYYREALAHWGLEDAQVTMLALSENATFLVVPADGSQRLVLRLHRPGYRKAPWVLSELAWVDALAAQGEVQTAPIYRTLDGEELCAFTNPEGEEQLAVLTGFLEGKEPMEAGFGDEVELIGRTAAVLHRHARTWTIPEGFRRMKWRKQRILGELSDYGDWRNTPEVDASLRELLEQAEAKVLREMDEYGIDEKNFGLIHTDLRSSNLLVDERGGIKVLDFDDCGFGWYVFDMACTFSFEEDRADLPELVDRYLRGYYGNGGVVDPADLRYLPTMLMARRLQLVAWMEMRRETELAQQIRARYVPATRGIAEQFLRGEYLIDVVRTAREHAAAGDRDGHVAPVAVGA